MIPKPLTLLLARKLLDLAPEKGSTYALDLCSQMDQAVNEGIVTIEADEQLTRGMVYLQWAAEWGIHALSENLSEFPFFHVSVTRAIPTPMCKANKNSGEGTVLSRQQSIPTLVQAADTRRIERNGEFFACHCKGKRTAEELQNFNEFMHNNFNVHEIPLQRDLSEAETDVSGAFWIAQVGRRHVAGAISANQFNPNRILMAPTEVSFWIGTLGYGSLVGERIEGVLKFLLEATPNCREKERLFARARSFGLYA